MLKLRVFIALFLATTSTVLAQSPILKGTLKDAESRQPLIGATVKVVSDTDSSSVITDNKGVFEFNNLVLGKQYQLNATYLGYELLKRSFTFGDTTSFAEVLLNKEAKTLTGVTVVGNPAPVRQKADTVEMNANQFKVNPDANTEDLIKKAPGITVENGQVKVGGEQVRKVTVDGRDFFGDDAAATLRNLPAEVVDKIQVFDRMSDQAQFTGVDDGNTAKSINIVTKPNMRNGQFGRIFLGYGTDNHYLAGGNVSFFKNNRRISIVGLANDVNQQNFTEQDLLGVTSSSAGGFRGGGGGGPRGGGGPGGGGGFGGFGGGGGGFLVGQQPGISKTNSFGLNYNDKWGKSVDVSGSYFFNNRNNVNTEDIAREYFLTGDSSQFYNQSTIAKNTNYNHRANFRFDYKIDSFNSILITPSINIQRYSSNSDIQGVNFIENDTLSTTENLSRSERVANNFNNNILYRHSFAKRGRTFSINLNTGINNSNGETFNDAFATYFKGPTNVTTDSTRQLRDQETNGFNINTSLNYTEPIGSKGASLEFRYNPSFNTTKSNLKTFEMDHAGVYSIFDTSLSNVYENHYVTQRGGVSFRKGDRNRQISFGLDFQSASLNGKQEFPFVTDIKRTFTNILPNANINFPVSKRANVRIFYRANTNAPSISQLQEVINNTNPLFVSTGNPELNQQYTHRIGARYQYANTQKGSSLFINIFGQRANDYVANATYIAQNDSVLTPSVTLFKGSQLTKPINLDGQWNMNTFITYGMPLKFIKTNMNVNAGFVYNRTPGFINNVKTFSKAYNFNTGIVLASNISQYVDFTLAYNGSFNNAINSQQPELNNKYIIHSGSFRLNLLSKNGWLFNNDLTNQTYSGLSSGFNQNYWLWNMAVGKKFLKDNRGELRLSVFDLLDQNQSITRTVSETYIEDVHTRVLQQYFMLTFTYSLKNFGTPASRQQNRNEFNRQGGMPRL